MNSCFQLLVFVLISCGSSEEIFLHFNISYANIRGTYEDVFILENTTSVGDKETIQLEALNASNINGLNSYFAVCSSQVHPSVSAEQLSTFIGNSCIQLIPLVFLDELVKQCVEVKESHVWLYVINYVPRSALLAYHSSGQSLKVTLQSRACYGRSLKTALRNTHLSTQYHVDVLLNTVITKPRPADCALRIIGVVGKQSTCRRLILWVREGDTTLIVASGAADGLLINYSLEGKPVYIRCMVDAGKSYNDTHVVQIFVNYIGDYELKLDVPYEIIHPVITKDNPHLCVTQVVQSPDYVAVSDMEIAGIYSYLNLTTNISLLACPSSLKDIEGCDGVFLPIFSGEDLTLPSDSSFFLGPSNKYDIFKLVTKVDSASAYCIDFKLSENADYKIDVMLFAAPGGKIPPQASHKIDISCPYDKDIGLAAIMYRSHTNKLGTAVSMWVEHRTQWNLLASSDQPDRIVKLDRPFHIRVGDVMNVRCTYDSHGIDKDTLIGPDMDTEEMCNFYLFYITSLSASLEFNDCFLIADFNVTEKKVNADALKPRRRVRFGTDLELIGDWSLPTQDSKATLGICNLEHGGTVLIILERFTENYWPRSRWFNEDNVLQDLTNFIKTDALTVYSVLNHTVLVTSGANRFYLPSGLAVTNDGELFISDLGLHQVYKFSNFQIDPGDKPRLSLGTAFQPGNDPAHFCMPTSVVVDDEDNIYVGDGLCNARIVKFEDDGFYVDSYGEMSGERGVLGYFGEVTDLTLDTTRQTILALDNKLKQLQAMKLDGEFVNVIDVARYREILKISYSNDLDAILILTSHGIIILDPITGFVLDFVDSGIESFSAITVIPGNNTVYVGSESGMIMTYYRDDSTATNRPVNTTNLPAYYYDNEVKPLDNEIKPPDNEIKPPDNDVKPHDNEVKPPDNDVQPHDNEVKPPDNDVKPPDNDVKPHDNEVKSHDNEVKPPDNDVKPHDNDVKPPDNEVKPLPRENSHQHSDNTIMGISPLIHYLYMPGLPPEEDVTRDQITSLSYMRDHISLLVLTACTVTLMLVLVVVLLVRRCGGRRRGRGKREYERCLMSESEGEEDVLYDSLHERFELRDTL